MASLATERKICSDPDLASTDMQIHDAYGRASSAIDAGQAGALKLQQRAWVKRRNLCASDHDCIARSMQARLDELTTTGGGANRSATTLPSAPAPVSGPIAADKREPVEASSEIPYATTRSLALILLDLVPSGLDQPLAELTRGQIRMDQAYYKTLDLYRRESFSDKATQAYLEHYTPVFAREAVERKSVEFIAPSLEATERSTLLKLAARTPRRFWIEHTILDGSLPSYDHARQELTLSRTPGERNDLFSNVMSTEPRPLHVLTPGNTDSTKTVKAFLLLGGSSLTASPYNSLFIDPLPKTDTLALDRLPTLGPLPYPPDKAEALFNAMGGGGHTIKVRALFEVTGAAHEGTDQTHALLTRIEQMVVVGPAGETIARLSPERFISADVASAGIETQKRRDEADSAEVETRRKAAIDEAARKRTEEREAQASQAAKAGASALERLRGDVRSELAGEPFGYDVMGVKLGTPLNAAIETVRKQIKVGQVAEYDNHGPDGVAYEVGVSHLFVSEDGKDAVVLLTMPGEADNKVLGVRHLFHIPSDLPGKSIENSLAAKYGKSFSAEKMDQSDGFKWSWGVGSIGPCEVFARYAKRSKVRLIEGPPPKFPGDLWGLTGVSFQSLIVKPAPDPQGNDLSRWIECSPYVSVSRQRDTLMVESADARVFPVLLERGAEQKRSAAPSAPPMKF